MEIICLNYRSTFHIICCRYGIRCSVFSVHCSTNKKSTSGFGVLAFPIKLLHFKQSNAFPIEFELCIMCTWYEWTVCKQKPGTVKGKWLNQKSWKMCALCIRSFHFFGRSTTFILTLSFSLHLSISLLLTFLLVPSVVDVHVKCRFAQTSFHKC